jgi:hypothetical protein
MKTKTAFINALAIAATITLTASVAMAHSAHDHSTVPYKWEMSNDLKAKMYKSLKSEKSSSLIGLSHFEQKKLNHYEIKTGNKFNTVVDGYNFLMERTSAGMKIVDMKLTEKVSYRGKVPIKEAQRISKASINNQSHIGHNHGQLPYEWTFGKSTQNKIIRGINQSENDVYVGLNKFEQSLLKVYGIKPGNTFQTAIGGHNFWVEMTTAGAKVINENKVDEIVMTKHKGAKM